MNLTKGKLLSLAILACLIFGAGLASVQVTNQLSSAQAGQSSVNSKNESSIPSSAVSSQTPDLVNQNSASDLQQANTNELSNNTNGKSASIVDLSPTQNSIYDGNQLSQEILSILGDDAKHYGVSVSLPKDDSFSLGINAKRIFYPASISKLPIAVLILRDVDKGKFSLNTTFELKDENKAYESDILYNYVTGSELSLEDYLKFMISDSDNTAMMTLENALGGSSVINQRTKDELGLQTLFRYPHEGTAKDVNKLLNGLYNKKYLSAESNQLLLDMMVDVASKFQDRIVAGVPQDIKVAHKIGEIDTDNGVTYADAGIVYGQNQDFILVIMNQDVEQEVATEKIVQITQAVYKFLEA